MIENLSSILASCCQVAPSADNSQPCHVDWYPSKLVLRYDVKRVLNSTFPAESQATLLSVGAAIENVVQCCGGEAALNVDYYPDKIAAGLFAEINLDNEGSLTGIDPQHPLFARHTNRFAYIKTKLSQATIDEVAGYGVGDAKVRVMTSSADIKSVALQVQAASEIRFQTQEVHEWLEKSLRFTPEQANRGDGLDVATLDLPPGGGAFLRFISSWSRMRRLNCIGAYKLLATIDAAPLKKAPAVIAITAPNTLVGAMDAGRLLCRAWIYLNTQGVACHPYYVISDQLERLKNNAIPEALVLVAEKVRKDSRQLLDLKEGETLMMLLRVGYPTREAPRSKRLPLEQVFTDFTVG